MLIQYTLDVYVLKLICKYVFYLRSQEMFSQLKYRRISDLLQYLSVYPLQAARMGRAEQKHI